MMIKIGGLTLRGPAAAIVLLVIIAVLVVVVFRMHPRTGMLISGGLCDCLYRVLECRSEEFGGCEELRIATVSERP